MDEIEKEKDVLKTWSETFKYRHETFYKTINKNEIFDTFKCLKSDFAPKLVR